MQALRLSKRSNNFKLKNCLFSTGEGWWSFDNSTVRNDNRKNIFLMLGEGPTFGINGKFGSSEKKLCINFTKANTKVCLSLHYNTDNS